MDIERAKALFKRIAQGFNLHDNEIERTLRLPEDGLLAAIRECFQQIENPRAHFSEEDYSYLVDTLGCVNLAEVLESEPLTAEPTLEQLILEAIFNMPTKFTPSELKMSVYLQNRNEGIDELTTHILRILTHPNVKLLVQQGEYYSLNHNAKVKIRSLK